ncbi:MAG: virulence factor BrkB family protein [Sedimenticola sp.]
MEIESEYLPSRSQGKLKGRLCWGRAFLRLLFSRFSESQGLSSAASLTFTTLLSLVPLMTVGLAVFAAFPVSDQIEEKVQSFLFENFMPASGEVLKAYLQQFSSKASRLSSAGFAFLIVVALMMMASIDHAFNIIWRVQRKRSPLSIFMVYWAILSLGPLLIGGSVVVTSYLVTIPILSDAAATFSQRLLGLTPLLASTAAFSLLYIIVPNRRVLIRHAVTGGFLAALLFELAKKGFTLYLTHFPTYEAIYGALAVIPIFLVWVYLSWVVTLLGAEFTYCLGIFGKTSHQGEMGSGNSLLLAFRLLQRLWQAQHSGDAVSLRQLSSDLNGVSEERLETLLVQLRNARLVLSTEEGAWVVARDLSAVSLLDLYLTRPFVLPDPELLRDELLPQEAALGELLGNVRSDMESTMALTLDELYRLEAGEALKGE